VESTFRDRTCLGCGCACDDVEVVVRGGRIVEARNACSLGLAWFGDGTVPARTLVEGRDASLDEAIDAAARLIGGASRPVIYLAPDITCEAQRGAIALADAVRGVVDTVTSANVMPSILATQELGRASATLGEVRNRADVLVFWGVDPSLRYPRYWSRYAPEPAGVHVPHGRRSRTVVAVDVGDARGPSDADVRLAVAPDEEVAVLTALKAGIGDQGSGIRETRSEGEGRARDPRSPIPDPDNLLPTLVASRYLVFVADAEPQERRDAGRAAALIALTQALNGPTRCALSLLRAGGNRSGADACLTSQTGYPTAVDFSRGYPRYRPFDATLARIGRADADAVLVVGAASLIPPDVAVAIARLPHAVIGPRASDSRLSAGHAAVDTGIAGIHDAGLALRMDDVPLPVGKCLDGPPDTLSIVRAIRGRVSLRRRRGVGYAARM
jgi:formylmethanofuran dehydrogenase subunit B